MPKETFFNLPDDKRERLLQIAIDEFADNDYQNASISRIVKEMGIAKGSFYQYFEDKKDLFMYLIDLSLQEKHQLLGKIEIPANVNMFEMLRLLFQMQVKFDFEHPRLSEVGHRAIYREVPFKSELLDNLRRQGEMGYRQMVERGIADGSIDPHVNAETAVFMVSTIMMELGNHLQARLGIDSKTMITRSLTDAQWAEANQIFDELVHLLQMGLGRKD